MPPLPPRPRAPQTHHEWEALLRQVITRAASLQDRRLPGLRKAQETGQAEAHLRRLSVLYPADLDREFPLRA